MGELGERHVPFLELSVERPVAGFDTQALGFVDEQARGVGLVDEDHAEGENEGLEDSRKVEGPAPTKTRLDRECG